MRSAGDVQGAGACPGFHDHRRRGQCRQEPAAGGISLTSNPTSPTRSSMSGTAKAVCSSIPHRTRSRRTWPHNRSVVPASVLLRSLRRQVDRDSHGRIDGRLATARSHLGHMRSQRAHRNGVAPGCPLRNPGEAIRTRDRGRTCAPSEGACGRAAPLGTDAPRRAGARRARWPNPAPRCPHLSELSKASQPGPHPHGPRTTSRGARLPRSPGQARGLATGRLTGQPTIGEPPLRPLAPPARPRARHALRLLAHPCAHASATRHRGCAVNGGDINRSTQHPCRRAYPCQFDSRRSSR